MGRSGEDADTAPHADDDSDAKQPVGATTPELSFFPFRLATHLVPVDCVCIAQHHRETERKGQLLDEHGQVEDVRNAAIHTGTVSARVAVRRRPAVLPCWYRDLSGGLMAAVTSNSLRLDRYVPRIATDWDIAAPDQSFQELDATLCFVDISGFTNLSEKLARRGRIGAEELTGVLNYVFGSMLEIAYLQGGSLLKFGGDALLLIYTGHDHATRAASAAVEMRSALRAAAQYQTSVGRLRLRMSVGIHSGPIHLFRVGESHHELVIAGPGGTTTTLMEKTAEPGEILVSEGTRDRLPGGATGDRKGDGWLLRWRQTHCVASGVIAREARGEEALRQWVPASLRDFLSAGETEPEHRIANVAFVRFCRVDEHMADEGPEWVAEAIDKTMKVIQSAAEDEEITFLATDINEDGGKAILVAGAPVARAEDEGRILRAARRIADADLPLDVHIGINRGHVFTGEVGTEFRATYTVMGDTVNLAARLMAAAPARAIYATPNVLDQSGTVFATTALEPFHVKGKSEPVKAYAVGEETGVRDTTPRDELPFVGRAEELEALVGAIRDAASDGQGSITTVIGDAGFGKSRLVDHAAKSEPGVVRITIRAEPYGSATPYRPLRDPLRNALGVERASSDEMATSLRSAVEHVAPDLLPMMPLIADVADIEAPQTPEVSDIEPRFRQDRTTAVVADIISRVLTEPMLLLIEDAQWMDDASSHLLEHFADTAHQRPWAIVVTRRPGDGGFRPEHGSTLTIGELPPPDAEQLIIDATRATPLRPHEINAITARTGGNPLFIAEVLRVVAETGSTDELPDSLGTLVSTSIDALPTLTRRVLRYASVLGRSFRTSTVRAILEEDEDLELDAATRALLGDFLEGAGSGRLQFRTAMVRDVAYDGLSFRRRTELHRRAAKAIAATASGGDPESVADQLAMHYSLGNDYENTWTYARIAAHKAARSFANVEAAIQLERALEASRRLPELPVDGIANAWVELGDVREQAGLYKAALDAYRRAHRLHRGDPMVEAELLLKRAGVREREGSYSMALRESTQARHKVDGLDDVRSKQTRARATAFQANVRLRQGRRRDAYECANAAIEFAMDADERSALARAFSVMAWTQVMEGEPGAADLCWRALNLYEEVGDLAGQNDMNNNLGYLAYFDGRWNDALDHYERSSEGAARLGNVVDAAYPEVNVGEVLVNQRRYEDAEKRLTNAVRVLRATGENSMASFAEMLLARVYIERGELDRAEATLSRVIDEASDIGFATVTTEASLHAADVVRRGGEPQRALELLDSAMKRAGEVAGVFTLTEQRYRAEALLDLGRTDDALEILESSLQTAEERDQLYDVAMLLEIRANVLGGRDPSEARSSADRARSLEVRMGIESAFQRW